MHDKSDNELVLEVQTGKISSYEPLVNRYQQRLFWFVNRIVFNEHDAKDVVQETFIHVYKHIDRFDVTRSFSSYIYAIAKNEAITLLRKRKPHVSIDKLEIVDDRDTPFQELIRLGDKELVVQAIKKLEPKYKNVIRLYYFDELSYEEIGRKLKIPINTVRTLLRRGKTQLKQYIEYEKN
jgi:RNA polymerase sigma-70 factor, ECF subfamily